MTFFQSNRAFLIVSFLFYSPFHAQTTEVTLSQLTHEALNHPAFADPKTLVKCPLPDETLYGLFPITTKTSLDIARNARRLY